MLITNSLWDILYTHCGCIVFLILKESIMLKIQLIGNVAASAERRVLKDGSYFLVLNVAVNGGTKDRPRTDWIKVNINSPKLIAVAEQYVTKGTLLYIEGFPGVDGYINKEGQVVATQKVSASSFKILGSSNAPSKNSSSDDTVVEPTGETHSDDTTFTEDDIPSF